MKKTLKAAVALSVLSAPAMAANMENPLYIPKSGEIYSKTGVGVMYKKTDSTTANKNKDHAKAEEFPIIRIQEDLGIGITDRLNVYGMFGWTQDDDINRKGMHQGRLGLSYRAFDGSATDGWVWDIYGDMHLGGVSEMKGTFNMPAMTFDYDNYSNGRWGAHVGSKFGKTWNKFTAVAFAEALYTFGNSNNSIELNASGLNPAWGDVATFAVDLKSTLELNAGLKAFYQINDKWSTGLGFTYKHHHDNGVKSLSKVTWHNSTAEGMLSGNIPALVAGMHDMEDGFDEYIFTASVANQVTDSVQVALYGDYTFDTSHPNSQNGTDIKFELGARVNVAF